MLTYMSDSVNLTENDSVLLNVIKAKPELVLTLSIREFAKESFVSPSAVVRFYKKLGFKTYQGFLIGLAKELEHHHEIPDEVDASFPFSRHDTEGDIVKKIADLSCETIQRASMMLDDYDLNRATDLLMSASSIYAIGVSHSFNRIMDFHTKMLRIHKFVKVMPLQSDQYYLSGESQPNDVVIIVSYGGVTVDVINNAREFKKRGTHIIAITANQSGELASLSTIVFPLPKLEHSETNISSFASQIAIEYVLNTLYSCIYKREYEDHVSDIRHRASQFLK